MRYSGQANANGPTQHIPPYTTTTFTQYPWGHLYHAARRIRVEINSKGLAKGSLEPAPVPVQYSTN